MSIPPCRRCISSRRGKTVTRVAYSDEERDAHLRRAARRTIPNAKIDISRYKGLGEMDPHELWETTMDPEKRTLQAHHASRTPSQADETFTILMGEKVEPRKEYHRAQGAVRRQPRLLKLFAQIRYSGEWDAACCAHRFDAGGKTPHLQSGSAVRDVNAAAKSDWNFSRPAGATL